MNSVAFSKSSRIMLRVTQIAIFCFLFYLIYFFYQPYIFIFNYKIFNPIYTHVKNTEWWIYAIIYFIIISFLNLFILEVLNFYFTKKKLLADRLKRHYELFFTKYLVNYLFPSSHSNEIYESIDKIKHRVKTRIQIISFFDVYARIQESAALDLSQKFISLMSELNMRHQLEKLLYSSNFSDKILALKIIFYLRIEDYNNDIVLCSRSDNYALRNDALTALIRLSHNLPTISKKS